MDLSLIFKFNTFNGLFNVDFCEIFSGFLVPYWVVFEKCNFVCLFYLTSNATEVVH